MVVGGAGGIGRHLVRRLTADCGAAVAVIDLAASLARHAPPPGVIPLTADARDDTAIADAFATVMARWGGCDAIVNLCGYAEEARPVVETEAAVWQDVMAGNLTAAYHVSRRGVPLVRPGGSLVHMASGIAQIGTPGYGPYGAAKAGVINLVRTLAQELAPAIRVNAVAPAAVDTAFLRGGTGRGVEDGPPRRLDPEAYAARVPLGRLAVPEDVVGPILFLLGPGAGYITGQTLYINGGTYFA
ncbi:MAG: SDR family oxidoreductase [Azospirillaceae bacterium]